MKKAPLCFLETMHLEESWPIDREALSYCYMNVVVCKYVLVYIPTRNIYCFAWAWACLLADSFLLTCDGYFKFKGNSVALW